MAPFFDKTALEELGPAYVSCFELVEVFVLGVVCAMAITEIWGVAVINVTVQGLGATVVVMEKRLEGVLEEDVLHSSHAAGGAAVEVCLGFWFLLAQAAGDGLGGIDVVEDFAHW